MIWKDITTDEAGKLIKEAETILIRDWDEIVLCNGELKQSLWWPETGPKLAHDA